MAHWIARSHRRAASLAAMLAGMVACSGPTHRLPPPSTDVEEMGFRDAVRILASDEFEGRKPGTPGEEKTVAYLVERFRKLGLKPGNGESFLQAVPLVEITADPDAGLSIAGRGAARSLEYAKDMVIWTRREVPEASVTHSPLVFVGYGIVAPDYGWNDYAEADVRGKTVIAMVGDPGTATRDPKSFRGVGGTYYGSPAYKAEEAARQGAAGVLLIHDAALGTPWTVVVNDHTVPQVAAVEAERPSHRAAIEGWLTPEAARAIFRQAGLDFDGLTRAASRPGFHVATTDLVADATVHNTLRRFTSSNVAAVLPGSDHRREFVIYTAHWDHLGRQPAPAGGAVFNGAVDDASGVAGLLMLAQSFVRTHPATDRSLAFIAFTGGDAGLLGSAYYVEHPLIPLRDTVAVLNLDTLRIGGPTRDVTVFGAGNSELEDYAREAALLQGREIRPDPNPEWDLFYRSDDLSFARSGIPALHLQGGLDDSARGPAWGRQQREDYLVHRYHQTADQYAADWDVRGTLDDLRLYYEVGNRLGRARRFPRFYPDSEFLKGR